MHCLKISGRGRLCLGKETRCVGVICADDHVGVIGLTKNDDVIIDMSFDILSLEALFMVPR